VTFLPDREVATVQAWFAGHPDIKVLSRDRGGGYGEAALKALPAVIQVADRWHRMENATAAFLIAVRKSILRTSFSPEETANSRFAAIMAQAKASDVQANRGGVMRALAESKLMFDPQ
jgi:transposase